MVQAHVQASKHRRTFLSLYPFFLQIARYSYTPWLHLTWLSFRSGVAAEPLLLRVRFLFRFRWSWSCLEPSRYWFAVVSFSFW
jgi:hypothetical protein